MSIQARTQSRVACILLNIWRYYEFFLPKVRQFQDLLKSPIQTRLQEQVKIGKWDNMSTYGLIEHSEKIHRKLNQVRLKFIDVFYLTFSLIFKIATIHSPFNFSPKV